MRASLADIQNNYFIEEWRESPYLVRYNGGTLKSHYPIFLMETVPFTRTLKLTFYETYFAVITLTITEMVSWMDVYWHMSYGVINQTIIPEEVSNTPTFWMDPQRNIR